jgi:secreted trypsin-like serine protease
VAGFGVSAVEMFPIDTSSYGKKKLEKGIARGDIFCENKRKYCFEVEMTGEGYLRRAEATVKGASQLEVHLNESKGQGTCSGDSGGPAFIIRDGKLRLWGVTSRGSILCDFEGVYTNLVEYRSWIEAAIGKLSP